MVHHERYTVFVTFIFILMAGIGLMCICKLNASCDACCDWKMKWEYPGKSGIRARSGTGASSPMKGQPVIIIPSPKHESLEAQHQEIAVQEWANELTEAHLDMDHDMVHMMHNLTDAMDHMSMGGLAGLSTGGQVAGVSMGVCWLGGSDRGISKGKGKEKEWSEEGDAGNMMMPGDSKGWGDDGGDDWSSGGGNGCGSGGDDDDDAPVVEY